VKNSPWKKLRTWPKTDCGMNEQKCAQKKKPRNITSIFVILKLRGSTQPRVLYQLQTGPDYVHTLGEDDLCKVVKFQAP
jgi:hypothetical protein